MVRKDKHDERNDSCQYCRRKGCSATKIGACFMEKFFQGCGHSGCDLRMKKTSSRDCLKGSLIEKAQV
jgi:hypothetical protein